MVRCGVRCLDFDCPLWKEVAWCGVDLALWTGKCAGVCDVMDVGSQFCMNRVFDVI